MIVLSVPRSKGQIVKEFLLEQGLMDRSQRICQIDDKIEFPVLRYIERELVERILGIDAVGVECFKIEEDRKRARSFDPIDNIRASILKMGLEENRIGEIPEKWELVGDVLVLKIPNALGDQKKELAKAYAKELGAKTVLEDVGGVKGELREPGMERLLGKETETIHKENGIKFKLDTAKIMFSSGNVDERIRMGRIGNLNNETIVDMFAGIGYFTLPLAVYSKPKRIYACEKNPVSFEYLKKNLELNRVQDIVEPLLGDNRETAPEGVADRVLMGYVGTTHLFLEKALKVLKEEGGIVHYHETCPNELLPERPVQRIKEACSKTDLSIRFFTLRRIKSYAPGVTHVVVDVEITK